MSSAKTAYRDFRDGEEHRFTSDLIHNQVPEYYVDEGPLFIKMLQEYYNFSHTGGNYESAAKNMIKLNDVDEVAQYFDQYKKDTGGQYTSANTEWTAAGSKFVGEIEQLWRRQYLLNMPTSTASFHIFLKQIVDVYRRKGSSQAFEALMLGIYGIETEIKRPFNQTFKASDGVWNFDQYLQVPFQTKLEEWVGRFVYGESSSASARVQAIIKKNVKGRLIAQLLLTDISTENEFEHNENIYTKEDSGFQVKIIAGIKDIVLSSNGSEFVEGDEVLMVGDGVEGTAVITEVDTFNGLLSFTLNQAGSGYRANAIVTLVGGVGGAGANFKIGGIKAPFRLEDVNEDVAGAFFTNSQIQIGNTVAYFSNSQATQATAYVYNPIASPNSSNGLNISWKASQNLATLDSDVANNTFTPGSSWMLGNTTAGNSGHFATLTVHDYYPSNSTIQFTTNIPTAASTNTAVIRQAAANSVFNFNANLSIADINTALDDALVINNVKLGAIDFIVTTSTGRNYIIAPTAVVQDTQVFKLRIPDGAGGFLGDNAVVDVRLLANNVITRLKISDHGFGYTNTQNITLNSPFVKGTPASGKLIMGGVSRSSGGWTETNGFPDADQRIHDSDRYQAFSYEVVGQESLLNYKKTMTSIAHTAGTKMFGRFQTSETSNTVLHNSTEVTVTNDLGAVTIANNQSNVVGFSTTYGGSSDIGNNDLVTTNGLRFRVANVNSNTSLSANQFSGFGISNSAKFTTTPTSANVTVKGSVSFVPGLANVTGTNSFFRNQIRSGYSLALGNTTLGVVDRVESNTFLVLKAGATNTTRINSNTNVQIVHPDQVILEGNVALSNGSVAITGTLTDFVNQVQKGDILVTQANVRIGTVNSVPTSTSIRLANTYRGQTLADEPGVRILHNRSLMTDFQLSGELSLANGSFNITGQNTQFQNELQPGDKIFYEGNTQFLGTINKISSNTVANLMCSWTSGFTGRGQFTPFRGAALSTDQKKFGTASLELEENANSHVGVIDMGAIGTGDFTHEMWIWPANTSSTATQQIFNCIDTDFTGISLQMSQVSGANGVITILNNGGGNNGGGVTDVVEGQWSHVAISKQGTTAKLYVNGNFRAQVTNVTGDFTDHNIELGRSNANTSFWYGYIDEYRMSTTARYTANFTAPTSPFSFDEQTRHLFHFDGLDGANTFTNGGNRIDINDGKIIRKPKLSRLIIDNGKPM